MAVTKYAYVYVTSSHLPYMIVRPSKDDRELDHPAFNLSGHTQVRVDKETVDAMTPVEQRKHLEEMAATLPKPTSKHGLTWPAWRGTSAVIDPKGGVVKELIVADHEHQAFKSDHPLHGHRLVSTDKDVRVGDKYNGKTFLARHVVVKKGTLKIDSVVWIDIDKPTPVATNQIYIRHTTLKPGEMLPHSVVRSVPQHQNQIPLHVPHAGAKK